MLLVGEWCCPRVTPLHATPSMLIGGVMLCEGPRLLLTVVVCVAARLRPGTVLVVLPLLIVVVGVRVGRGDACQQDRGRDCWCRERVDA